MTPPVTQLSKADSNYKAQLLCMCEETEGNSWGAPGPSQRTDPPLFFYPPLGEGTSQQKAAQWIALGQCKYCDKEKTAIFSAVSFQFFWSGDKSNLRLLPVYMK